MTTSYVLEAHQQNYNHVVYESVTECGMSFQQAHNLAKSDALNAIHSLQNQIQRYHDRREQAPQILWDAEESLWQVFTKGVKAYEQLPT